MIRHKVTEVTLEEAAGIVLEAQVERLTIRRGARVFVAVASGVHIGVASLSFKDKGRVGILKSAYTKPEFRRMGVHESLITRREVEAKLAGAEWVETSARTTSAKAFKKRGYTLARAWKAGGGLYRKRIGP